MEKNARSLFEIGGQQYDEGYQPIQCDVEPEDRFPSAGHALYEMGCLLGKIAIPDQEILAEPDVSPKGSEREKKLAEVVVERLLKELGSTAKAAYQGDLVKVSVVGVGMRVHTGVAQRMFGALAGAGINIQNITTSEIKISCIIAKDDGAKALKLVHDAFELDKAK